MSLNKKRIFNEGLWDNNPIFRMALGLCSTLAVTNLVFNTLVMTISVFFTLLLNSLITSILRGIIPERVRMISYMIITSTIVIVVDMVLKVILPDVSKQLGPYVALIITNCIIMGRAEAFAINNGILDSVIDAVSIGLGYSLSLIIISILREIIGFGTFMGIRLFGDVIRPISMISTPPGAFFMLGILILVINTIDKRKKGTR